MVHIRIGEQEARFPEGEWEAWVSEGRVPADALVFSLRLTAGLWRRADSLPLYEFFRRTGEEERHEAGQRAASGTPFAELPAVAFPRRGFSGTETLLAINLFVALALALLWRAEYPEKIFDLASLFHRWFRDSLIPVGFIATLFMHANLEHIMANMVAMVPSSAFVEFLYGRRVLLIYLGAGLTGAIVSYVVKNSPPMSIGASGAIYGLIGAVGAFVIRYYPRLPRWHRWKARRVYAPILVLAILPSIFNADWRAHVGGFLGGLALGLVLSLGPRGRVLLLDRHDGPAFGS
jgi:membrane associated rhomboid family serine protease